MFHNRNVTLEETLMKILHNKSFLGACVGLLVLVGLTGVSNLDLTPAQSPRASAVPLATYLYTIYPNPSTDGFIHLIWDAASGADYYRVYRNTSFITSLGSLTPIINNWYITDAYDDVSSVGLDTYYYVVVGVNIDGDGPISNCQSVDYIMGAPSMYPGMPQSNGQVMFGWSTVSGAADYSVYRESSLIVSTSGLTPVLANTTNTFYMDTLTVSGNYYYAVTAFDGVSQVTDPSTNFLVMFQTTSLDTIAPNPTSSPTINLNWNDITGADVYMVFWNATAPITEANVMYTSTYYMAYTSSYSDNLVTPGTYYYAILPMQVMSGAMGYGILSDCESVTYTGGGMPAPDFVSPIVPRQNGDVPLQWTSVPTATTYKVYREATPILDVGGLTPITSTGSLSYTDSLSTEDTYYYAVTAENATDASGPSTNVPVIFRTTTLSAIAPNPTYSSSITLDWNDVTGADMYAVLRNTTAITEANMFQNAAIDTTFSSTYVDTLPVVGTYYYAIVPANMSTYAYGVLSNCESVTYSMGTQLTAPILGPFIPKASGDVDLLWSAVSGALSYNVYREATPITDVLLLTPIANPTGTSYIDTLSVPGTYFYAVTALNATDEGPVSASYGALFRTETLASITPNPTDANSILLDWNDVTGADSYLVFRNTTAITESNLMEQVFSIPVGVSTLTDTTLPGYGTYYYAILAVDSVNYAYGVLSNCQSVVYQAPVILTAPVIQPFIPLASGAVNLEWTPVIGALNYNVYRELSPITDVSLLTPIASPTGTTYSDSLSVQDEYFYAVTAENATVEGPQSICHSAIFRPVTLSAIIPNPTDANSIVLDWNDIPEADTYVIFRNTTAITESNIWQQAFFDIAVVSTYTDTSLPGYGTYYYAVIPFDSVNLGYGLLSDCESVVYQAPVTLTAPLLAPFIPKASGEVDLQWTPVTGALSYNVYREATPITDVTLLTPIANPTGTSYIDTLSVPGTYFYAVTAVNATDEGPVSASYGALFRTETLASITPNPTSVNSIVLDWNDVTGADTYLVFRNTTAITESNLMQQIGPIFVGVSTYTDTSLPSYGTYYYAILAVDSVNTAYGVLSNCQSVVYVALASPTLDAIAPNPTTSFNVNLNWNDVTSATGYYVYRSTSTITSVTGLTPIVTLGATSFYADTLTPIFDTYYYVVVATNGVANSSISNCVSVLYTISIPVLDAIAPNPTTSATINLNWNDITGALSYHVYRSTSTITDVSSMTPIASPGTSAYVDTLSSFGTYYYVVVATNGFDNTTISNNRFVIYYDAAQLQPPIIDTITPDPTTSATVNLNWNDIPMADHYHVYRSSSTISDVTGMTPIGTPTGSSYGDTLTAAGTYYYVVVASNATSNSTLSNCVSVSYTIPTTEQPPVIPPPEGIPGMSSFLLVAITAIMVEVLGRRIRRASKR